MAKLLPNAGYIILHIEKWRIVELELSKISVNHTLYVYLQRINHNNTSQISYKVKVSQGHFDKLILKGRINEKDH